MIAFEELVAALDRWRIRNGMPVVTGDVPSTPAPIAAAPAAAWSPPAAPAWAAPAAATAAVGDTSDVVSLDDEEVLEDEYDNDGADFAMKFDGAAADPETTASGPVPSVPPPAMPEYGDGAPAYDPYAAQPGSGPYAQPGSGPYAQPGSGPYPAPGSGPYAAPGSGPYPAPGSDPYAQGGSGGYPAATTESDPAYDDPAYDPPGAEGYEAPVDYAEPSGDTIDADADVIDEATVVGDELPKR